MIFVCKILEYSYEMADALLIFYFLGFLLSASLLGYIFYLRTRKRWLVVADYTLAQVVHSATKDT